MKKLESIAGQLSQLTTTMGEFRNEVSQAKKQASTSGLLAQGKLLYRQKRYQEAMDVLRGLLNENPDNADIEHWLGLCLLQLNRVDEAIPILLNALEKHENPETYKALGEAFLCAKRVQDAEVYFRKAFESPITDKLQTLLLAEKAHYLARRDEFKKTLYDLVNADLEKEAVEKLLVEVLIEEGDHEEAINICNRNIELNPDDWAYYRLRAKARLLGNANGDSALVLDDLKRVIEALPEDDGAYRIRCAHLIRLAVTAEDELERKALLNESVAMCNQAMECSRDNHSSLYVALSLIYLLEGNRNLAEKCIQDVMELYSSDIHVPFDYLLGLQTNPYKRFME